MYHMERSGCGYKCNSIFLLFIHFSGCEHLQQDQHVLPNHNKQGARKITELNLKEGPIRGAKNGMHASDRWILPCRQQIIQLTSEEAMVVICRTLHCLQ